MRPLGHEREIAGICVGASAILLVWQQQYQLAAALLGTMLGFFIGEKNGERKATPNQT